uniref:Carboxylesterase type B domain-containing protein n=1 Tax=Strigamia maritima TaxID=126957 RepID=T1JJ14_STRMM
MCVASMAGRASTLAILLLLLWLRIDPCEAFGRKLATRVVTTKFGGLRGLINTLPNKHLQPVEMFLGIPFAPPPVGYLRFMPPMSLTPWRSVRLADRFGPVCPQKYPDITNETAALQSMSRGRLNMLKRLIPYLKNQSEDCLYLNVYTPTK